MNKYHLHNYKYFWLDVYGSNHRWRDISDDYLNNIHRKIKNNPRTFPVQALYYCEMELDRRKAGPAHNSNFNTSGFDMASPTNHYQLKKTHQRIDTETLADEFIYNNEEKTVELKDNVIPEKPMVKAEDLPKYFNRKVKLKDGKKGIVIAIYSEQYRTEGEIKHQIRVMIDGPYKHSYHLTDANQVELIDVLTVFAYQSKDGTIEWTSKNYIDATLKRKGMKRLPNATKYIDLD